MIRCCSCLIPDTRPDTGFHGGLCSACLNFGNRDKVDWQARKRKLECILEGGKNSSGFDCIVPSSGGKDSHYQVLTLLAMGARPLVVTATTCFLTPVGRANIDNLARYATTIEVTPNREVRAKLNRFGLETVGDISYPEHMAIFSIPFQMASKLGIPLIFYGESPQREYGCPAGAEEADMMDKRWVHEFGGLLGMRANDCIGYDDINAADMSDYLFPEVHLGLKAYFLGQFIPWNSRRNAQIALDAGMQNYHGVPPCSANWWKEENLDNAMTGLHDHFMYRKYGYGRGAAQLSVDIRNGILTRDIALSVCSTIDGLFPYEYCGVPYEKVLKQINMPIRTFAEVMARFTNLELFKDKLPEFKAAA